MSRFKNKIDYKTLSIKDLLEARDTYHFHLANLDNVVGTAIGYYRFHPKDKAKSKDIVPEPGSFNVGKCLHNTVVTSYSYPSVLVFIDSWKRREDMSKKIDQYIPPRLYLRDGRVIPTCVIAVEKDERAGLPLSQVRFPSRLFGGGFPSLIERQGQDRIGTIGCLVTDGNRVYALTNLHVAGRKDEEIFTMVKNTRIKIGKSADKGIGKINFSDAYPGWPGYRAISNLDAGLIELEDINDWTAQVFSIGVMGEPVDLNVDTINLDLIGCPVVAYGGASGIMRGEIQALFYRYKSIGGFDYIADFLIGSSKDIPGNQTRPGDSGTIWFYDEKEDFKKRKKLRKLSKANQQTSVQLRPLAIQWGGHAFLRGDEESTYRFALASNLATVCRELDVELIRDWEIGLTEYWGKLGHFVIAQTAVKFLSDKLKILMSKNLERITYKVDIGGSSHVPGFAGEPFVPLADVPDLIWKARSAQLKRNKENGNHYLNLDLRGGGNFNNKYLKTVWEENNHTLDPEFWTIFYNTVPSESNHTRRGALPFRVWQIYDDMVKVLKDREDEYIEKFVAMAGVLAHYVADACMPLHNTKYHHGLSDATDRQKKVHNYIDNNILSINKGSLLADAFQGMDPESREGVKIQNGKEAADYAMELLIFSYDKLKPKKIINAYNESLNKGWKTRYKDIREKIGDQLIDCIREGTFRLAEIWQNAWDCGEGGSINPDKLIEVAEQSLSSLYLDKKNFLPCRLLKDLKVDDENHLVGKQG